MDGPEVSGSSEAVSEIDGKLTVERILEVAPEVNDYFKDEGGRRFIASQLLEAIAKGRWESKSKKQYRFAKAKLDALGYGYNDRSKEDEFVFESKEVIEDIRKKPESGEPEPAGAPPAGDAGTEPAEPVGEAKTPEPKAVLETTPAPAPAPTSASPEPEPEAAPSAPEPDAPGWAEPLDPARLEMMARQEIERIERDTKSKLSEEEKDVIRMVIEKRKGVGAGLAAIDQRTAQLYETTYRSISKSSKLKRFLTGLGKVVGAGVVGATLRTALRAIAPGFHFAGSVVGGVVGGTFGGLRGYFAEKNKQFGLGAITTEFQELAKTDKKRAAAFLHEVLTTQSFRGNHKELLNILALFRAEAASLALTESASVAKTDERLMRFGRTKIAIDEITVETLLTEGLRAPDLLKLYREDPTRRSMRTKAALKGALRGVAIGAGIGLASDLIGMYLSHARSEEAARGAYAQFMEHGREGRLDYINRDAVPLPTEAHLPSEAASPGWLASHELSVAPTDYGNALKHAIYSNDIRPGGVNFSEEQYRGFLQLLNYVKPEQVQNLNVPLDGGAYHFDAEILQGWVNNVFHSPQGIDFQHIAHADSLIGHVTEGVAQKFGAAAAVAAHPEGFAEMATHAAAVGAGVGLAAESRGAKKAEGAVEVKAPAAPPPVEKEERRRARSRDKAMDDYHRIMVQLGEIEQELESLYEDARSKVKNIFSLDEMRTVLGEAELKDEDKRREFLAHAIWVKKDSPEDGSTTAEDARQTDILLEILNRIIARKRELERQAEDLRLGLAVIGEPEPWRDVVWIKRDLSPDAPEEGAKRARVRRLNELTAEGRWRIVWTDEAIAENARLAEDFYLTKINPDGGDNGLIYYTQDISAGFSLDQTSIGGDLLDKIKELKKIE